MSLSYMEARKAQCTQVQTQSGGGERAHAVYKVQAQEAKLKRKLTFFSLLSLQNRVGLKGCSHFDKIWQILKTVQCGYLMTQQLHS